MKPHVWFLSETCPLTETRVFLCRDCDREYKTAFDDVSARGIQLRQIPEDCGILIAQRIHDS